MNADARAQLAARIARNSAAAAEKQKRPQKRPRVRTAPGSGSSGSASASASAAAAAPAFSPRARDSGYGDVDLERFKAELLSWDFVRAVRAGSGHGANAAAAADATGTSHDKKHRLPDSFPSVSQYIAEWAPLALAELRATVLSEATTFPPKNIALVELSGAVPRGGDGAARSPIVSTSVGEARRTAAAGRRRDDLADMVDIRGPNDLVLLVSPQFLDGLPASLLRRARPASRKAEYEDAVDRRVADLAADADGIGTVMLGLTSYVRRGGKPCEIGIDVSRHMWSRRSPQMWLIPLGNIVSGIREIEALLSAPTMTLRHSILAGENADPDIQLVSAPPPTSSSAAAGGGAAAAAPPASSARPRPQHHRTNPVLQRLNSSQATAIDAASVADSGFTLIKGPPGTGKTTTTLGLLNLLYLREYQRFYDAVVEAALVGSPGGGGPRGGKLTMQDKAHWEELSRNCKPRLLVTAPSNVGVDNIVARIIDRGFVDNTGARCNPKIVRVGSAKGITQLAQAVTLQVQVDALIGRDGHTLQTKASMLRHESRGIADALNDLSQRLRALVHGMGGARVPVNYEARIKCAACGGAAGCCAPEAPSHNPVYMVYYCDHAARAVCDTLPPGAAGAARAGKPCRGAAEMPEYLHFAGEFVRGVETLNDKDNETKLCEFAEQHHREKRRRDVTDKLQAAVLDGAHLVFSTLNSTAMTCMEETIKFKLLVVDEAAQAVELATLIPMRLLKGKQCVLVGDPQQLPATTFAKGSDVSLYQRSLFQRLEATGQPVHLLDTQYRMHPSISLFPRVIFYDEQLKDGGNVSAPAYERPFHTHPCLAPFTFFHLEESAAARKEGGHSLGNRGEARLAVRLFDLLESLSLADAAGAGGGDHSDFGERVAVITPYKEQVSVLSREFGLSRPGVEIGTVDGFQGREKSIVIVSTVRSAGSSGVGFLKDVRRMNVALTRAKHGMYVIGNETALSRNEQWGRLVRHAKAAGHFVHLKNADADLDTARPEAPVRYSGGGGEGLRIGHAAAPPPGSAEAASEPAPKRPRAAADEFFTRRGE